MTEPSGDAEQAELRARLAALGEQDARSGMPAEVRERLERTIAEQGAAPRGATVTPLRRRTSTWVAAAAVVLAAGVGVGALLDRPDRGEGGSAASSSAESASPSPEVSALQETDTSARQAPQAGPLPVLRAGTLAADIRALAEQGAATRGRVPAQADAGSCTSLPEPRPGQDIRLVRYQGEPAVVVISPPQERAVIYDCTGAELRRVDLAD